MQLLHARRCINHNTSQLSQIAYVCLYFDQPLHLQRKDQRIAYNIQNKAIEMVLFILLKSTEMFQNQSLKVMLGIYIS